MHKNSKWLDILYVVIVVLAMWLQAREEHNLPPLRVHILYYTHKAAQKAAYKLGRLGMRTEAAYMDAMGRVRG